MLRPYKDSIYCTLRQFRQQQKCIGGSPTHANSGSNKGTVFHRYPDLGQQAVKVGLSLPLYCILISLLPHLHFTLILLHQNRRNLYCRPLISRIYFLYCPLFRSERTIYIRSVNTTVKQTYLIILLVSVFWIVT